MKALEEECRKSIEFPETEMTEMIWWKPYTTPNHQSFYDLLCLYGAYMWGVDVQIFKEPVRYLKVHRTCWTWFKTSNILSFVDLIIHTMVHDLLWHSPPPIAASDFVRLRFQNSRNGFVGGSTHPEDKGQHPKMSQGCLVALGGLEDFLPLFLSFAVLFLLCSSSLSSFELSRSPKSSSMPLTSVSFWCFLHPVHRTLHSLLKRGTWFDSQHVLNNLSACSPSLNESWLARLHFHESTGTQNCAVRGLLSSLKFGFSTTIGYSRRQSTLQREKRQPRTAQCGVPVATTWALHNLNGRMKAICRDLLIYDRF